MKASRVDIHYLSHASIPSGEANSLQVMKMCEALARRGDGLVLYCKAVGPLGDAHAHYGVAPLFRLAGLRGGSVPLLSRSLFSLRAFGSLRRARPAGLLFGRDYHTLALIALTRTPDLAIVLEVHQPPGNRLERALLGLVLRSRRFLRLIAISQALADEYQRLYPGLRGRVTVAHDGADPPPAADERAPRSGPLVLGYVGSLYPGKGMETIEKLALRLPEARFEVIGGQPHDLASWKERIRASNVSFHGHLPHAQAQERMRSCHVLLAPFQSSVWIGGARADIGRWMSPLKVFEYMASGRPMVVSDLPVLREVLRHRGNALLVEPEDLDAWVAAIGELATDENLAHELAARAREDLVRNYTWDRRVERILADLPGELP